MVKTVKKGAKPRKTIRKRSARLASKTVQAVKAIVKSQMNKVVETKIIDYGFEFIGLYHNTWYQFETDPFTMFQGTSDAETINPINRVGDSIFAKGILYKIHFTSNVVRPNSFLRIVILKVKGALGSPANISLHPQLTNNLIAPIDREQENCRQVMYDKVIHFRNMASAVSGATTTSPMSVTWGHYLKLDKKVSYDNGSAGTKGDTYRIFVLPYDNQATSTADQVARFSYFRRTYFQDA